MPAREISVNDRWEPTAIFMALLADASGFNVCTSLCLNASVVQMKWLSHHGVAEARRGKSGQEQARAESNL